MRVRRETDRREGAGRVGRVSGWEEVGVWGVVVWPGRDEGLHPPEHE